MDVILSLADDYVLDSVWAWALPAVPRSLSGVDSSSIAHSKASGFGSSSKVASPSSSALANLSASLASVLGGRSAALSAQDSLTQHVIDTSAEWQSLHGASLLGRDHFLRYVDQSLPLLHLSLSQR